MKTFSILFICICCFALQAQSIDCTPKIDMEPHDYSEATDCRCPEDRTLDVIEKNDHHWYICILKPANNDDFSKEFKEELKIIRGAINKMLQDKCNKNKLAS